MWRRVIATQIQSLSSLRSASSAPRRYTNFTTIRPHTQSSRHFSTGSGNVGDKKGEVKPIGTDHIATDAGNTKDIDQIIDEINPIVTGQERAELALELQGKKAFEGFNDCSGHFGTEENPAIIKSYYNARIVGCVGDSTDHEHDVLWFWLREGHKHVCPYCEQVFMLQVDGPGEHPPDGPDRPSSDDEYDEHEVIDNVESEGHKLS